MKLLAMLLMFFVSVPISSAQAQSVQVEEQVRPSAGIGAAATQAASLFVLQPNSAPQQSNRSRDRLLSWLMIGLGGLGLWAWHADGQTDNATLGVSLVSLGLGGIGVAMSADTTSPIRLPARQQQRSAIVVSPTRGGASASGRIAF